jgi:Spy/CpxP family protein refolding chaperone
MFKKMLKGATLGLSALLLMGGAMFAQEQAQPAPGADAPQGRQFGRGGKMGRQGRHGRHQLGRVFRELNLTDAQKEQLKALRQQSAPQREEARKLMQQKRAGTLDANGQARLEQLKAQAKATKEANRAAFLAILTPEQKAQIEQFKQRAKDRGLNLTDAQRQQMKALHEKYRQQDGPQRQEAMKLMQQKRAGTLDANGQARLEELHKAFMGQREARRAEFEAILTPEQKAKMEQMRGRHGMGRVRQGNPKRPAPQN